MGAEDLHRRHDDQAGGEVPGQSKDQLSHPGNTVLLPF